ERAGARPGHDFPLQDACSGRARRRRGLGRTGFGVPRACPARTEGPARRDRAFQPQAARRGLRPGRALCGRPGARPWPGILLCCRKTACGEPGTIRERLKFFRELIQRGLADRIALGHTLDDQAETVLFRLLRGSGLAGLAGILPVTADSLIRPLLGVTRDDVLGFLRTRAIPW